MFYRSGFLSGFGEQIKVMKDPKRIITVIVFLAAAITTLTLCFVLKPSLMQTVIIIVGILIQYAAFFWYNLSFIPFGQKLVTNAAKKAVNN